MPRPITRKRIRAIPKRLDDRRRRRGYIHAQIFIQHLTLGHVLQQSDAAIHARALGCGSRIRRVLDDFDERIAKDGVDGTATATARRSGRARLASAARAAGIARGGGIAHGIVGRVRVAPRGGPGRRPRVRREERGGVDGGGDGVHGDAGAGDGDEVAALDGVAVEGEVQVVRMGGRGKRGGWGRGERSDGGRERAFIIRIAIPEMPTESEHAQTARPGFQEPDKMIPIPVRIAREGNAELKRKHGDDEGLATDGVIGRLISVPESGRPFRPCWKGVVVEPGFGTSPSVVQLEIDRFNGVGGSLVRNLRLAASSPGHREIN
ncbi:hypothetical protein NHQ30_009960 [Ciborinia camelliae]|nr:hypothetical protein NHQ30_009960 [Ciborinia camelliae]